jgi:hypothetical protein
MEICGALCDGVVILVVAQQEVDIRAFLGVNLGDCCHWVLRRASLHAVTEFRLVQVLRDLQQIGKG